MREIVLLDANTIWHRGFAEALAGEVCVTAVNPQVGWVPSLRREHDLVAPTIRVTLPRGWASGVAFLWQRILARLIWRLASSMPSPPVVVLTSPAYAPLAKLLEGRCPIVSYTADDYRSYEGWGGSAIVAKEQAIYERSALSLFVSEALRDRATQQFGLQPERTAISPNATEPRFAYRARDRLLVFDGRAAPIVGILGGLSDRLDLEAIASAISCPAIGTFLVAGPVDQDILARYPAFGNDKVLITGRLPHSEMHLYAAAMDLAIIPYARSNLNYYCSPMRLYDHLAAGAPIIALEGCDQIDKSAHPSVNIVRREDLVTTIETAISCGLGPRHEAPPDCFWQSRVKRAVAAIEKAVDDKLMPRQTE